MPGARVGFLVLDRNGNGVVDSLGELFGQAVSGSRHPEGPATSLADLALFDRPEQGGNGDGLISAADAVFAGLRVWVDLNHDGVSQPGELLTLAQAGIASIALTAQPTGRRDRFGNYFRARVVVRLASGRETAAWDVFLAARLNGESASAPAPAGAGGTGPISAGLAGLGTGLIAFGLGVVVRRRRTCRHGSSPLDVARGALSEGAGRPSRRADPCVAATGLTTLAVVLLLPSASFGQTWQVVEYYDSDALGSIRAVTNQQGQVVARHDFLPFGEELNPQTPPHDTILFTGQERDFETGQDYFNARQLRTDLGRFLTPDAIIVLPLPFDSQSLNGYSYVNNNPSTLIDPSGLNPEWFNAPKLDAEWSPTDMPAGAVFDQNGATAYLRAIDSAALALQAFYDAAKNGPEDPSNPGHPLYLNPIVKKAAEKAFMATAMGNLGAGSAEAGFTILWDGKAITTTPIVSSVDKGIEGNKLALPTPEHTYAYFHTHGNKVDPEPGPGDVLPDRAYPTFVYSKNHLYVVIPDTWQDNGGVNKYIRIY